MKRSERCTVKNIQPMVFGIFTIIQRQVTFIHKNHVKMNSKKLHVYRIVLCIKYLREIIFWWIMLKGIVNNTSTCITKWVDFFEILVFTTGNSLLSLTCFTLLMCCCDFVFLWYLSPYLHIPVLLWYVQTKPTGMGVGWGWVGDINGMFLNDLKISDILNVNFFNIRVNFIKKVSSQ